MNDKAVILDGEELFQFLEDILIYYRTGKRSPHYSDRQFVDWVVIRAAQLHARYVLEPKCGSC